MSIPMELVLKAEAVCDAYEALGAPGKGRDEFADLIAGAILAERNRCADIADNFHHVLVSRGSGRRGAVAYDIKEAILAGAP